MHEFPRTDGRFTILATLLTAIVFVGGPLVARHARAQTAPLRDGGQTLVTPATETAIDRGLTILAARQNPDGSFGQGSEPYRGNVAICSLAGLAFLAQGSTPNEGKWGRQVESILNYLLDNAEPSGLIIRRMGGRQESRVMYGHGLATLFLAECYGMSEREDLRDKLDRAVRLILQSQNAEGGWRYDPRPPDRADISVTAAQVMALRAAKNAGVHVPKETIDRAVDYVKKCQNADGGFMYRLPSGESGFARSAMALASLQCAGIHEGPEVDAAFRYLDRFAPSDVDKSGQGYFFFGHYYAGQAYWLRGGLIWPRWYGAIRDELLSLQNDDGTWFSFISVDYATACSLIVLQLPNGYLPIFRK